MSKEPSNELTSVREIIAQRIAAQGFNLSRDDLIIELNDIKGIIADSQARYAKSKKEEDNFDFEFRNSLALDEDDWVIRQLFEIAGCDPKKRGHWRLLLGILAENVIDPAAADSFERKYSPAALNASRWDEAKYERLFEKASELARRNKWKRLAICRELAERKVFDRNGHKYKTSALLKRLDTILASKRSDVDSGRLDGDPARKQEVEDNLALFKFKKIKVA